MTSQVDFNENLAVKYSITSNTISWTLFDDGFTHFDYVPRSFNHFLVLLYSQFVIHPVLARHPTNSGLLTWDNGGTT